MTDHPTPKTVIRCITLIEQEFPRLAGSIQPDTQLARHDIDSFDRMGILLNVEQDFDVSIDDATAAKLQTPRDFADAVTAALATRKALA